MAMPHRQPSGMWGIPREDPATGHRRTPLRSGWTAQTCQTWKARARVVLYRWNVVSGVSIGMDSQGAESSRNGGYGEIRERGERAPRPRRTGQSSCAGPLGVGMPVDSIIQIFLLSFQDSGDEEPGFIF
jgi:hypothetical protein